MKRASPSLKYFSLSVDDCHKKETNQLTINSALTSTKLVHLSEFKKKKLSDLALLARFRLLIGWNVFPHAFWLTK